MPRDEQTPLEMVAEMAALTAALTRRFGQQLTAGEIDEARATWRRLEEVLGLLSQVGSLMFPRELSNAVH